MMQYRKFGNTGVSISALGFGCMRLPEVEENGTFHVDYEKSNEMLRRAAELGVNYFDTAYFYCHADSEVAVGKALKPIRDKVYISTKCPMENVHSREDYRRLLEDSLRKLDTDYIDFYHFWAINKKVFDEKIMGLSLIDEALKAKAEGKIRHISFSFHDDPSVIQYILEKAPEMETMLVQYNMLDRKNEEMIAFAASRGVGVVAMGPVGGGRLAAPTALGEKIANNASLSTYELAFRFVLGNPNISCALSGMQTLSMVEQNVAVAEQSGNLTKEDFDNMTKALEDLHKFSELYCTGCGYCQPCPKGINIPRIFADYTYYNVYGLSETAKKDFSTYENGTEDQAPGATSKDCVNCGYCERKCPQHLSIRSELKRVEEVLRSL